MMNRSHFSYLTLFCGIFLSLIFIGALFPHLFTPYSFEQQHPQALLLKPCPQFWLGTDELGRDLLSRLLYGARISLCASFLATFISAIIGVLYGSLAAIYGGTLDQILMRLVDLLYSIPDLLFYILLGLYLGKGFFGLLLTLSCLGWVSIARLVRGEILKQKTMPYIEATHALGLPSHRILIHHLIPQIKNPLLVTLLFKIPALILAESTLSFIGLGIAPPYASWGSLASTGYSALRFYPHLILFPSFLIFATIFCFQTLGTSFSKYNKIN